MDKILLSDEETYKLLAGCEEINCLFKVKSNCTPCARMMKAQHLKSIKAVFEAVSKLNLMLAEEPIESKSYLYLGCYILNWGNTSAPSIGLIRFSESEDYEAIKKQLLENIDKLEGK